jgi:hypothetical protein
MAVAVEAGPEGEPSLITQTTDELLQHIYSNYQPGDELPDGVKIESPWGSLVVTAPALGERAITAYFDDGMELDSSVLPMVVGARQVLIEIVRHQRDRSK